MLDHAARYKFYVCMYVWGRSKDGYITWSGYRRMGRGSFGGEFGGSHCNRRGLCCIVVRQQRTLSQITLGEVLFWFITALALPNTVVKHVYFLFDDVCLFLYSAYSLSGSVLLYFVCILGSIQYSQSHCPVLLHVYLHLPCLSLDE